MSRGDRWLIVLPIALTALGVVMVYSSSAILGITRYQDPNYFLSRQLFRAALGIAVLLAATQLDLKRLERWAPVCFGVSLGLLALAVVAGHVSHGASRWLRLGFLTLQPTDAGRLAAVTFLAWWLKRHPPEEAGFWRGLVPTMMLVALPMGLILMQPNLSSAGLLALTGFLMIFLAGAKWRHLLAPVAAGTLAVAVALKTHPYMMERWGTFARLVTSGETDGHGAGWQLDQSLIAIGSGGWLGRGLGGGLQKFLFLPEAHTDFIFSILAEELGFLGATVLLVLIALLIWRGLRTAARAHETFDFLLASGLTLQLALYALANLAVATGLAPTTGLPLPYVSYGGSALLANLAAAGLLYRVSVRNGSHEALTRERWSRRSR